MAAKQIAVAVSLCAAASASSATALAYSTFSDDADGWQAKNGAVDFQWLGSGGNFDGYVQAKDQSGDSLWFFSAPAKFLGNKAAAYGGTLSFDLRVITASAPLEGAYADIQLIAGDGTQLSFVGALAPASTWTAYQVSMVAGPAWRVGSVDGPAATAAQMSATLSNLSSIRIRGDFAQAGEATALDSVLLTAGPVPEPATVALWLLGLGTLLPMCRAGRSAAGR